MTLSILSFVVFLDPYQGSDGICLLSKYVVFVVWGIVLLPSLSSYSNKALISGAHRWEIKYTYLQDILLHSQTMDPEKQVNIKMCMCGEWMVYGEDVHTFLALWSFLKRMRCSIFSFSFLSGGYLILLILLSDTCPFLPLVSLFIFFEVPDTCPFLFPRIFLFFRALTLLE